MKKRAILLIMLLAGVANGSENIKNGSTDISRDFVILDSAGDVNSTLTPENFDFYWHETGEVEESDTSITACASATADHVDGTCFHIGHGVLRCDFPDDCFDGGIGKQVLLYVVDAVGSNRTSYLQVDLSTQVDANTVSGSAPIPESTFTTMQADLDIITGATGVNLLTATQASIDAIETLVTDANLAATAAKTASEKIDTNTELRTLLTGGDNALPTATAVADVNTAAQAAKTAAEKIDTNTELRTLLYGSDTAGATAANQSTIIADTNEMQQELADGGRLDLIFDATLADTGELQIDWANGGRLDLLLDTAAAGAAGSDPNAIADQVLDELITDHDDTPWSVGWILRQLLL